jgi:transcriptional regulator GlxA family with amidase domain
MIERGNRSRIYKLIDEDAPIRDKNIVQLPAISPQSLIPMVRESRLRKVLQRIEAGPPQSVSELARGVRLSPAHLQRLFKQETGVHISDLLVESRLRNAAHLLSTTEMEIKEIAYLVGYQHHSSFVRAFQRRFHQSPKQYRRPPAA